MKYIIIALLCIPLTVKSQDTIHIPYPVAKQITKDLIDGDSAKAELKVCNEHVTLLEHKVELKNQIISAYIQKDTIYEERIKNEQLKFETQGLYVKQLVKKNKKLKVKLLFTKVVLSGVIGGLTYLYITK